MFKELKNGIEILIGQAAFKLQIKTINFNAIFEFLGQFTL